jgi:hypothetical protein
MITLSGTVVSISNTKFLNINPDCFFTTSSNANNPLNSMIKFSIKKPYKVYTTSTVPAGGGGGGTTTVTTTTTVTQTLTLDNLQVDTFKGQAYNSNSGRLFEF